MHFIDVMRGKLFFGAASLILWMSGEFLKWQFPVAAATEKASSMFRHASLYLQNRAIRANSN